MLKPQIRPQSQRSALLIIVGVILALLLGVMDQSIVATAGPTIISDLGGLSLYAWVFSAFILAQTVSLAIFGKLSDVYGRKKLFLLGLVIFLAGSVLSGASQRIEELIVFRAIQGVGSGAFFSIGLAAIGASLPPERRARALGIAGSIFGAGAVMGPTVGSYLVQVAGWRWIFYVNLPIGIVSFILVSAKLIESRNDVAKPALDWLGVSSLAGWVSLLLLGLLNGGSTFPWLSWQEILFFAGSGVLFVVFLNVERKAADPILPLSLFKIRTISSSFVVQFMRGAVLLGLVSFIPLFIQGALAGTIDDTRNVLYAFVLPFIVGSVSGGQVVARLGTRAVTFIGSAALVVGSLTLATLGSSPSIVDIMERAGILGLGLGITITAVLSAFQNSVERRQIGVASSVATFSLNLGGAMGVAILGSIQLNSFGARLSEILHGSPPQLAQLFVDPNQVAKTLTSPRVVAQLMAKYPGLGPVISEIRIALATSIIQAFILLLVMSVVALIASLFMTGSTRVKASES
jgi:EmrB/QacA subfamily drug resistance transporter